MDVDKNELDGRYLRAKKRVEKLRKYYRISPQKIRQKCSKTCTLERIIKRRIQKNYYLFGELFAFNR